MSRKGSIKSGSMLVRQTDDGLHLADSILWFDARGSGELSFLSSAATTFQSKVPQVIATEETVRILEAYRKKPNALVCQYNRPFSIGRLRMELLPSGCVLGGASLYVETDSGRLLYAPQLQTQRIPTVRQMQLKKANALVLGVSHPDPTTTLPNRKKERERLLESVQSSVAKGDYPVVLCDPVSTAQELTKLFLDQGIPVAVHDSIFRVNNIYETYGSKLGPYARYVRKHQKAKRVTIFPLPGRKTVLLRSALPDGPLVIVEGDAEPTAASVPAERFVLSTACDGPEIKEIVSAVNPRELYLFGPYAKRYVETLAGVCPVIKPLFPNDQPTLF